MQDQIRQEQERGKLAVDVTEPSSPVPESGDPLISNDAAPPDSQATWLDASILLSAWFRRARESQMAHYAAATYCASVNRRLGIPSIVFSAMAGTTLFATAQKQDSSMVIQVVAGIVALAAGALSALQTFLGLSERAEKHLSAGAAYGSIRREIEQLQVLRSSLTEDLRSVLADIRLKLDEISVSAPTPPDRVWKKAQKDIEHTSRPEGFTPAYMKNQRSTLE